MGRLIKLDFVQMIIFILAVSFLTFSFYNCEIGLKTSYMQVNFTRASCVGVSSLTRFVGFRLLIFLVWGFFVCVLFIPRDVNSVQQEHKFHHVNKN